MNIIVIGALISSLESSESEQLLSQNQEDSTKEVKSVLTKTDSGDYYSEAMGVSRCLSLIAIDLLRNN